LLQEDLKVIACGAVFIIFGLLLVSFLFLQPCSNRWEKQRLHFGYHSVVRDWFSG